LKRKINELEKQCEQPYVKNKERPYQLHAIMIHDGLAENGHYYTYVYDRIQKCWWQLNDHKSFQVEEEQVFREALGDSKKYKSACNLFYISKQIAEQIDARPIPLYKKENANSLQISKELRDKIHM
jgi:ubiquitin carboxyl-terminal hydrolase 25